ncbi:hypothetical protein JW752_03250 [Candidatus Peregrinibacteria bacterium]|nr:hypothetical protein [Candidatus Peregrinibacteria bacterium]
METDECNRYSDDQLREIFRASIVKSDVMLAQIAENLGGAQVIEEMRNHINGCLDCQNRMRFVVNRTP